jgi:MtN3 and saliva related transmembrane protein
LTKIPGHENSRCSQNQTEDVLFKKPMDFIEILGPAAGISTPAALVPQLSRTIQTKKAKDVSVLMFIVMMTGNALWVYYGFAKHELPIIATNFISLSFDIAMIILKFIYGKNNVT